MQHINHEQNDIKQHKKQEAQLPQRDCVTRYVSKFVLYFMEYGK